MEPIGPKLRRQRRRLGLTLGELSERTGISKPYLSLIETGRIPNPPSDEKLRRLEQSLGFTAGELISQAHLYRTPRDVRVVLQKLMRGKDPDQAVHASAAAVAHNSNGNGNGTAHIKTTASAAVNLDEAYLSGVLQELVDRASGNVETVSTNAIPVINRVSAGYPKDFTDMSYPKGAADDYVSCPDVHDTDAFAARVHGDSMQPKYAEGDIVIFSPVLSPKDGDDCFVRFEDGHTTFKRIFFEQGEGGTPVIRLQPRNEKYRPQLVPASQVTGVYKAVYRYQRVD